jgi:hypothetical protein
MAVSASYSLRCDVNETLATNVPAAETPVIIHGQFSSTGTLNATSTPPATKMAAQTISLTAGAVTIDLTALTGTNGATVDGTGLKVQILKLKNRSSNAVMTFGEGASNGYEALGNAWTLKLLAGQEIEMFLNDAAPDIASGAKTIDVAGTGTESFDFIVVMG